MVLAEEAHRLGLVNHVHPADELMQKAREMAAQIAANGPIAVRLALEAALRGRSQPGPLTTEPSAVSTSEWEYERKSESVKIALSLGG